MSITQEKLVENLDNLTTYTVNFPYLVKEALDMAIINRTEKDVILQKYKSVYDKLTTFYLLISSKDEAALEKLPELLEHTGNSAAANYLKAQGVLLNQVEDIHQKYILNNLDRLCSHTMNLNSLLCYATGLELICGKEREIIAKEWGSETDQLAAFYSLVSSKGAEGYEKLIQVLKMTNNHWALEVLEYQEESEN